MSDQSPEVYPSVSLPERQSKKEVEQQISQIKGMVEAAINFDRQGMETKVVIKIDSSWGHTYKSGFVKEVSKSELSMAQIMEQPGTPITDVLSWPGASHSRTIGLLLSVIPPSLIQQYNF